MFQTQAEPFEEWIKKNQLQICNSLPGRENCFGNVEGLTAQDGWWQEK